MEPKIISEENIPKFINIKGYELNYKAPPLKGNIFRFRCRKTGCKYFIRINEENLNKILNKEKNVTFEEINAHENHKNKSIKVETSDDVESEQDKNKLAIQLINFNINQGLEFHVNNFKNNQINWKKNKIRRLLYAIRESTYPKDEIFLNSINLITIKLSDNIESKNEAFCLAKSEFINFKKNNKLEKYIIFGSEFQLNFYNEIQELFIDGTFKICPKNYYQLVNIFGFNKNKNFYMPLNYILLTSKNEELYTEAFEHLIRLIQSHTNIKSFDDVKITADFELGLRKSIKKVFKGSLLNGCFFHYCKAIWKKIKALHLFKKENRINTLIIAFILKAYPFIKDKNREDYCKKITDYCESLKGNYIKLKNYFYKYWKETEIFNFTELDNNEIINRTNNIVESFHRKLNHQVSHFHPKCSYLIEELKKISKQYYDKYINNLSIINTNNKEYNYISKDIINFIKKFLQSHKENINIDNLNQYLKQDSDNFYKLTINIFDCISLFNDDIIDNLKSIFIKNNLLNNNKRENTGEDIKQDSNAIINDNSSGEDSSESNQSDKDMKEYENDIENEQLSKNELYLINGDSLIEYKVSKKKNRKKKNKYNY